MDKNNNVTMSCPVGSKYLSDVNKCSIDLNSMNAPSSALAMSTDIDTDMSMDISTDMSNAPSTLKLNVVNDDIY